jgi:CHAD domain-containing protein
MAKAKEITGLDCAADALQWAGEVLRVRFAEVLELREAANDFQNVEDVHNMRVATRRLRGALRDFAPIMKSAALKSIKKDLKAIADALGAVRDEDVAIIALEKLQPEANESEEIKQGIEAFLNERRRNRERARTNLIAELTPQAITDLQENFADKITQAIERKQKGKNKRNPNRAISFNQAGRAAVAESFAEFYEQGTSLYEPFETEPLHEFRIAAKRLRYALELFAACWGEAILPFAEETSEMQAKLGEVHDADVWIEGLGERLRQDEDESISQAALWLLSEFAKKRSKNYREALDLWRKWQASNFAERMTSAIET